MSAPLPIASAMPFKDKSLLVITLMDFERDPNQRVQALVSALTPAFGKVVILSRARTPLPFSFRATVASLPWHVRKSAEGNRTLIRVNPFLNYADGLATNTLRNGGGTERRPRRNPLRRWAATVAGFAGILKDAALMPSLFLAYLFCSRERFDVCIAEGPWAALTALLLKAMRRVPLFIYEDVDYVAGYQTLGVRRAYVDFLERYGLSKADLGVSSGYLLTRLRKSQTGREVLTVPNGVDLSLFRQTAADPPRGRTLIYTGSLEDWAGLDVTMQALPEISRRFPGVTLAIIGKGSCGYESYLRELSEKLGIADRVVWLGQRRKEEVAGLLRQASVGLANFKPIPLRKYAFPLKVVEYMAAGLPVIGTKETETALIIAEHNCGEAIDYSADALRDCLLKLLADSDRCRAYSENGLKASTNYDWAHLGRMEHDYIAHGYGRLRRNRAPSCG